MNSYDPVGNLTNVNYPSSPDVRFAYDPLNRVTNMVDAAGTTKYAYTAGGQLWTEDLPAPRLRQAGGPWSNDTVTNSFTP
ncbi:MAG: RHS repeat protein [Verrucomicrobiae bacterium]|nr:RHS repeat protein [Verrucomicrobiae bacterium]